MPNLKLHLPYIVLIVFLIVMLFLLKDCNGKKQNQLDLQNQILNDSLKVTTNKLGQQTATISLIRADYSTFQKLTFAKEDSLGRQLQKLANRRTISATLATTVMEVDTVLKTDSVLIASNGCDSAFILNDTTEYRTLNVVASKDSFRVKFRAFEKLTFKQEWSKWNLFKKQTAVTTFTNSNPDVVITDLRTYTTECNCKKKAWLMFTLGAIAGNGSGFLGGYVYGHCCCFI